MVNPPGYPTFADTDSDPADMKKDIGGHQMVRVGHQGHGPRRAKGKQEALDWLERFAGFPKISGTQQLIVHMMRSPCSAFSSTYSLPLEFLS